RLMTTTMKTFLTPLLTALVLAGCATAPEIDPASIPAAPASFKEEGRWTQAAPAEAAPRGEWWRSFADPVLDDLIARADRNNTTIQVAAARLDQARAFVRASRANQLPQAGLAAGALRVDGLPTNRAGSPSTLTSVAA